MFRLIGGPSDILKRFSYCLVCTSYYLKLKYQLFTIPYRTVSKVLSVIVFIA